MHLTITATRSLARRRSRWRSAVGRSDFDEPGPALAMISGTRKLPPISISSPREPAPLPVRERVQCQDERGRTVVTTMHRPRRSAPAAARRYGRIASRVPFRRCRIPDCSTRRPYPGSAHRGVGKWGTAEIRVEDHAGRIEERPERWLHVGRHAGLHLPRPSRVVARRRRRRAARVLDHRANRVHDDSAGTRCSNGCSMALSRSAPTDGKSRLGSVIGTATRRRGGSGQCSAGAGGGVGGGVAGGGVVDGVAAQPYLAEGPCRGRRAISRGRSRPSNAWRCPRREASVR